MVRIVILLAAIVPPLLMLSYAVAKARGSWRSEAMWNAYCVGAVGAIAAVALEFLIARMLPGHMSPLADAATTSMLVAAIPEEGIKFFLLIALAERHVDVRRLQDIVILGAAVSLGLATLENFFYVISIADWKSAAALRAITSIPGHGIDGLAMGALLMQARRHGQWPYMVAALIVPIILHAAYDFPLFAIEKNSSSGAIAATGGSAVFGGIWLLVIAFSSVLVIVLCNHALARAAAADRASGRDAGSTETTDRLMVGGLIALFAGPMLGVAFAHAKSSELLPWALSILPMALGVDSIFTGLSRKRARDEREFRPCAADMSRETAA